MQLDTEDNIVECLTLASNVINFRKNTRSRPIWQPEKNILMWLLTVRGNMRTTDRRVRTSRWSPWIRQTHVQQPLPRSYHKPHSCYVIPRKECCQWLVGTPHSSVPSPQSALYPYPLFTVGRDGTTAFTKRETVAIILKTTKNQNCYQRRLNSIPLSHFQANSCTP
jgi:hypothetical protein